MSPVPEKAVPPDAVADETAWVDGELVRYFMASARSNQFVALLGIPVMAGVLWDNVAGWALLLWISALMAVVVPRFWLMARYASLQDADPKTRVALFVRTRYIWPLSAFIWGLSGLLHFDKAPLADQFICWLILAGLGMFSINSFSPTLRTMNSYVNTLALTMLGVMGWRIGVELRFQGPHYHYWLAGLAIIYWQILLHAGRRLNQTHRRNFELQYRNRQLIESLTRQTQAALDAVAVKNRFLASAAHDIRQPVHALGLYADWLSNEPELVDEIAPKIVESTKAVNALFDSLFDLSRLDAGKIKLNIEPVDLQKLLHDLELQYRPLAQAKGLAFRVHVAPGTAVSDPILLQRIVGNLIANAVKYTSSGGILVASRVTPSGRRIEIWDTGMGIAPEHQREIFREFYKIPAHAGTEDGFGLGLYIVGRLCGILGHPLTLASRPGRGTMFRLVLAPTDPVAANERAAASVAQLANMP
jgi:signal transduction histidine kinase